MKKHRTWATFDITVRKKERKKERPQAQIIAVMFSEDRKVCANVQKSDA